MRDKNWQVSCCRWILFKTYSLFPQYCCL